MVRNYDSLDPQRVVKNIEAVLTSGDMMRLEKGSYDLLNLHCGYIAHYNHAGFIQTYQNGLPAFVEQFLRQPWDIWLGTPRGYLYEVSYKGRLLADIIRELIPIFEAHRGRLEAAHELRQRADAEAQLHELAKRLGYRVVKNDETR